MHIGPHRLIDTFSHAQAYLQEIGNSHEPRQSEIGIPERSGDNDPDRPPMYVVLDVPCVEYEKKRTEKKNPKKKEITGVLMFYDKINEYVNNGRKPQITNNRQIKISPPGKKAIWGIRSHNRRFSYAPPHRLQK